MESSPLISVIVPIYKVEKYLDDCVQSLINQTYKNIEIILVDDGSPDNCGQMCDEYAAQDRRIKVIHKDNGGLSDARNVAIDVAQGEWITFVDSDDYVTEDYTETLYNLVAKYNCEISVALHQKFLDGQSPHVHFPSISEEKMDSKYAVEQMFYQEKFDNAAWSKLYHRKLFESGIRYPKGLLFEDLPTTYKLMLLSSSVAFTNKKIYYYRLRNSSIEGSSYNPKKIESALSVAKLMDEDSENIKHVEKAYRCRKFSFFFHILLSMPKDVGTSKILEKYIKENRFLVLMDRKARKKARVAAFVSYFGKSITKYVFSKCSPR